MVIAALQISNKIINSIDTERGDTISNLKLQKLLYYMQGFHLAVFDSPLFEEEITAWQYGPVVPDIYHHFKVFGSNTLTLNGEEEIIRLSAKEEELFFDVMNEYGQLGAVKLMNLTHEEEPWINAFKVPGSVISNNTMKSFFKTLLAN
jgi:uncharacterized phage-associated protein